MTDVLVDSNVILDLITEDRRWFAWSAEKLRKVADTSRFVINVVVHAEVSVHVSRVEELDAVLAYVQCSDMDSGRSATNDALSDGMTFTLGQRRSGS